MQKLIPFLVLFIIGVGAGYYLGYDHGFEKAVEPSDLMDNVFGDEGHEIIASDVEYFDTVTGYLAQPKDVPESGGKYPGLVLIHEWWGLNDNIKEFAEEFARQGYVALAVDLYNGQLTADPARARELSGSVRGNMEGAFQNLQAAVEYLKTQPSVDADSLASVGWCFGGGWSYEMAKNDLGVDASVIYYGRFNPEDDLSIMRANILGHFGEEDTSILVDDVRAFEAKLDTLSGDHQVFIYPNAGHAFANSDNEMAYVPEAAELSWMRTIEFLGRAF